VGELKEKGEGKEIMPWSSAVRMDFESKNTKI